MGDGERRFLEQLDEIESLIAYHSKRGALYDEDAEDFGSMVKVRLIENDYARLSKFQGRSSWRTYLSAVIGHLLADWQNRRWGRFRPSAAALRLGAVATQLETLLYRNDVELAEAINTLLQHNGDLSSEELEELARQLPPRTRLRRVSEHHLEGKVGGGDATSSLQAARFADLESNLQQVLGRALAELSEEDRFAVKARYGQHLKVTVIARVLGVKPKLLYRKLDRIRSRLRARVLEAGLDEADVREYLDWSDRDPGFGLLVLALF